MERRNEGRAAAAASIHLWPFSASLTPPSTWAWRALPRSGSDGFHNSFVDNLVAEENFDDDVDFVLYLDPVELTDFVGIIDDSVSISIADFSEIDSVFSISYGHRLLSRNFVS
jgi:hypothetical protein